MVSIHCESRIPWQGPFAQKMKHGLTNLGIYSEITSSRGRESDIAIVLGTTLWKGVEQTGRYLLVDRCSFGDTNQWVTLVWDGHGRRGEHKARTDPSRWEKIGCAIEPWHTGSKVVLCGQHDTYSPHYHTLEEWYREVPATHFRPHPDGGNPTALPEYMGFDDVEAFITLNTSFGVEAVMRGVPVVTMDEAAMAWDVTGHSPYDVQTPCRQEWLHWLAWTQWHHDEVQLGLPIKHLFEEL